MFGESKSLSSASNPITLTRTNIELQEPEFSLDSTPTDVDIHVIWTQIRENLRKSNSAVTAKKYYNPSDDSYKSAAKVLTKRQHPKMNRISIGKITPFSITKRIGRSHFANPTSLEALRNVWTALMTFSVSLY